LASNPVVRSRAQTSAQKVAVEAVSWMTPWNPSGSPINCPSHAIMRCSSSVAAGLVCHNMPLTPSPAESISPRMEGPLLLAGK
jgi:hypothetical protein